MIPRAWLGTIGHGKRDKGLSIEVGDQASADDAIESEGVVAGFAAIDFFEEPDGAGFGVDGLEEGFAKAKMPSLGNEGGRLVRGEGGAVVGGGIIPSGQEVRVGNDRIDEVSV